MNRKSYKGVKTGVIIIYYTSPSATCRLLVQQSASTAAYLPGLLTGFLNGTCACLKTVNKIHLLDLTTQFEKIHHLKSSFLIL